jgi:membrane protease YdiL (CAAX protease family)
MLPDAIASPIPPTRPGPLQSLRQAPEQREMVLIAGLAFFLNLFPGTLLQYLNLRWGLVITQGLFIAGPPLLAARWFFLDRRSLFPLRRPAATTLIATVLGTVALNCLLTLAAAWQERIVPTPEPFRRFYEAMLEYRGRGDFLVMLVVFAVIPAACEEVLFRGFLQRGFVRLFESAPRGILAGALVFAAFHLNPFIFPAVLVLGAYLGFLVHRTESLIPAILGHGVNNCLSIGLASGVIPAGSPPRPIAAAALAVFAVSLLLLRRPSGRRAAARML